MEFTEVNNDLYDNRRVVVHFTELLSEKEHNDLSINDGYNLAHKRALKLGGKIYKGHEFVGGFVFQSYNDKELEDIILSIISINALKEAEKKW